MDSDLYIIKGSTLNAIGNKLRQRAGTTTSYDPERMPEGIDEVYTKSFIEGLESAKDSPLPIEVDTEAEMTSILANATGQSIGEIYKYTGPTTGTYENDALYIVSEAKA